MQLHNHVHNLSQHCARVWIGGSVGGTGTQADSAERFRMRELRLCYPAGLALTCGTLRPGALAALAGLSEP